MSLQDLWQWPPSPAVVQRWEKSRARGATRYITRNTLSFAGPVFILMMTDGRRSPSTGNREPVDYPVTS